MRVTVFELKDGRVTPRIDVEPAWQPFPDWEGQPLDGVRLVEIMTAPGPEVQLVHLAAGGHFVMHSSPRVAFCQVVSGRGHLRLPGGRDLSYAGPELYVFQPDTLHEWHSITEATLLSVCLADADA